MFVALDSMGVKVDIDDADPEQTYYCPLCKEELIQRRGEVVVHHFAHQKGSDCPCRTNPTSAWHRDWQKRWPAELREVYFFNEDNYRISDVAIGDLTVEFQKSPMLLPKIKARTDFYRYLDEPRQVLWVFDRSKYDVREVIHYWGTGNSYRPSGYFCAPKAFWVQGAIRDKHEMMAFDYSGIVVVLTNWLTKEELNCDIIGVSDAEGLLNVAKSILILSKDEFVKLVNARASIAKGKWLFEAYVEEHISDILVSAVNVLSTKNIHVDYRNAINDAKRVYGSYVFSSIPSWQGIDAYSFFKGSFEDFDIASENFFQFVTKNLFSAHLEKEEDAFEDVRKEILSLTPLPYAFSVVETLDSRKVDESIIFFYLLEKLGLEFSTISKRNALAMIKPKFLEKNLAIISVAEENRRRIAKERAEAEALAHEEKFRREAELKRKEALERQAKEIARAKEEAKRLAEAREKQPFEPVYFLTDLKKFHGLTQEQKSVGDTFVVNNIPTFYAWKPPLVVHKEWKETWLKSFDANNQFISIGGEPFDISVGPICLGFDSSYIDFSSTKRKARVARDNKKVFWRVINSTNRSIVDILAVNNYGRICPYFVLNVENFDAAQIEKKTDVVVLDFGPLCCLLTGWQPIWKALQGATSQDSLGFTGADFTKYIAPFARTSLPESVQRGFDDTGRRSNMAEYAFFFKKEDLISFLKSAKYTVPEKKDLKKFLVKHKDEVIGNLRKVFAEKYSEKYLDELFDLEDKIVCEMSSNSYYANPYVYLKLSIDEDTGSFESSWTLDLKNAYSTTFSNSIESILSMPDQRKRAASFGDVRSLEAFRVDLMKIVRYLVANLINVAKR